MRQGRLEMGSFRRGIRRQPARLLALTGLGLIIVALFASAATPAPATRFEVSAPVSSTAGVLFSITVTALDGSEDVDAGYLGTVNLTSSDAQAVLPADYVHAG